MCIYVHSAHPILQAATWKSSAEPVANAANVWRCCLSVYVAQYVPALVRYEVLTFEAC